MATSDAGAHRTLTGTTSSDMWLGIATSADGALTTVAEVDDTQVATPRVLVPGGTGWAAPAGRSIAATNATDHGDSLADFTPQWIVFWDAATAGTPLYARRITANPIRTGDGVTIPADLIRLDYTD